MSPTLFPCPGCGLEFELVEGMWGRKAECADCGCKFVVCNPPVILIPPSRPAEAPRTVTDEEVPSDAAQELEPAAGPPAEEPAAPAPAAPESPPPHAFDEAPELPSAVAADDAPAEPPLPPPERAAPVAAASPPAPRRAPRSVGRLIAWGAAVVAAGAAGWLACTYGWTPRSASKTQVENRATQKPETGTSAATARAVRTPQPGPLGAGLSGLIASGDFHALQDALAGALLPRLSGPAAKLSQVLADPVLQAGLAQHELILDCGPDPLSELAGREGCASFLTEFLTDPQWVESFLISGPPSVSHAQALENLWLLRRRGEGLDKPVYRRLATAVALQAGKMLPYRIVDRFKHIQWAFRQGLLHVGFATMDVREMRWTLYLGGNAQEFQYLLDDRQTPLGDYFGACWACWYLGDNAYGDTVQGPLYYRPWSHVYGWKEASRKVGGVCGSLSSYGSHVAEAHGVMSVPVGQPGHCAYVIRSGEEWPVGYNVTWPTGFSVPGWDGTGYATAHRLYEPVYHDRARLLEASRLTWVARLQLDRSKPRVRVLPGLRYALYRQGVGAGLPDFAKLTPDGTGTVSRIDLSAVQPSPPDNFGVVWNGQVELASTGAVKVALRSDDSSRLLLDGQPVVSACCTRQEKSLALAPGRHPLRVEFSQGGGDHYLDVELGGVQRFGGWTAAYEEAIRAQPTHFGVWLDYVKALEGSTNVPAAAWLDLSRRAARTFAPYPEAAWALVHRTFEKAQAGLTPDERLEFLVCRHQELRQEKAPRFEAFPFDGILNWQADRIGDPERAARFFGRIVRTHSAKPPNDWIFGQVLNWGQTRFAANPKTAPLFAEEMRAYFREQGDALNADLARNQIQAGIRGAGERGDVAAFGLWCDMAERFLPALQPADVHLNPAQAAAFPKVAPFPGEVLSRAGLLRVCNPCQYDRPASYRQILKDGGFGGYFDTNGQDAPWATVELAGDSELSGIVLVNRYEHPPEFDWAVPLRVSLSTDGKAWSPVATFEKAEPAFSVNLADRKPRARYVKVERLPGKTAERFHLRSVLVYGKKLY